ncbi:unnamed protein product [Orchesella dallaii]|uniref:C2H2-type domain-containing protein n=1 Tax=Orchesella dallaii TaxID=48710 RepID=A0ABP1PII3_9HEXA
MSGEEGETLLLCSLCDEKLFQRKDIGGHLLSEHSDVFEKLKNGSDLWNSTPSWKCVECTEDEKMFENEQLFYSREILSFLENEILFPAQLPGAIPHCNPSYISSLSHRPVLHSDAATKVNITHSVGISLQSACGGASSAHHRKDIFRITSFGGVSSIVAVIGFSSNKKLARHTTQNSLRTHHDKEHPLAKFRNPLYFEDADVAYRRPRICCESCNIIFFGKSKLVEHVKNVHPETYWPCPHCQMLFYSEEQLNETHLASCFKDPGRQRHKRKGSNGKRGRGRLKKLSKRHKEKTSENDETESEELENSGNEDESLIIKTEVDLPIGTRSSSRIKGEPKNQIFRLNSKPKTATRDDDKLKEVKVQLTKLTKEQIDSY